jgi:hypothetical protein
LIVRGHDGDKCKGHHETNEYRPDQPQKATPEQPDSPAGQKADDSQWSLHSRSLLVAWHPNRYSGLGVAAHSRGMLYEINVDRGSGEKNATQHCKKLKDDEHVFSPGCEGFLSQIGIGVYLCLCRAEKSGRKLKSG